MPVPFVVDLLSVPPRGSAPHNRPRRFEKARGVTLAQRDRTEVTITHGLVDRFFSLVGAGALRVAALGDWSRFLVYQSVDNCVGRSR